MSETNTEIEATVSGKTVRLSRASFREVENPEPIEKISKGHVLWGLDNLYAQDLVGYRQDNPIHGGIIAQKGTFMSSAGTEITGLSPEETEKLQALIPEIVDDFETFNGFSIIFRKVGETWTASHVDFETVRFKEEKGWFALSDDWSVKTQTPEKTNYKPIKDIKLTRLTGENPDKEVIFYCRVKPKQRKLKNGKLSLCYYPVPNYVGAIPSILAGIEQDYFTLSEAVNGYKGGTFISLNNGVPATDELADAIADKIKDEATDRDKQGGITVGFSDGVDNAPTILSLNGNDLDKRYIESNKEIRSKIMVGHQVISPTLFGVLSESMFGSKEEMETAYTLFANNYVLKRQHFIADAIQWAYSRLGIKDVKITFNKYVFTTTQEADDDNRTLRQLNSMSPLVATKVLESMSPDEIRKLAALSPQATEMASQLSTRFAIRELAKLGVERGAVKILKSRSFDLQASDEDFLKEVEKFADLTKAQQLILTLIQDGKTFAEVSKAYGKGALALSLELIKLNAKGMLKGWKVANVEGVNIEVRYSYEVKAGLGAAVIDGTRDFCRDLIKLDRLYTREEIDTLSDELRFDVWRYRGGWYHNPNTGVTTPSCRHEWKQNVVRK